MSEVRGAIGIKDNVTAVLHSIKKEQSSFRKDVEATKKAMEKTWDKKHRIKVDTAPATKRVKKLLKTMAPLRKKVVTATAVKDLASAKIKRAKNKVKALGRMSAKPVIGIKNAMGSGLSKVKGIISGLSKAVVVPVTIVTVAGSAALGGAVAGGMKLEQQQISMEHFIGATNKDMGQSEVKQVAAAFTESLRENANATPFETGEVIAAGSRAIAIASGDTKEAMGLVKLAEDMAAASGGTKDISQAIEALADAKMGEMERLKEFGFKVSADEFKAKGFGGVAGDLTDFYGGAAEKLAGSGAGLLSTIKGKLKSNFDDFGLKVVDKLKPVFAGTVDLIDKTAPYFAQFGGDLAEGIGGGIKTAIDFMPRFIGAINKVKPVFVGLYTAIIPVVSQIMDTFKIVIPAVVPVLESVLSTVISVVKGVSPIIGAMVEIIGGAIETLAPVFKIVWDGISDKIESVIGIVAEKMDFFKSVFDFAMPLISDIITTAWGVIEPVMDIAVGAFEILLSVAERVFPGIQAVIQTVWDTIKPVVESIGGALENVAGAWDWLVDKVTGQSVSSGEYTAGKASQSYSPPKFGYNARGTDNWRGGLSWVGENGPELLDIPKGARILPSKSSVALAMQNSPYKVPKTVQQIVINLAKIADTVIVREEADIDKIGEKVAEKIKRALLNKPKEVTT